MDNVTLKILIIEDDVLAANSLETMLNDFGHNATYTLESSIDRIEPIIGEKSPDIILMDINLTSNISGIDLATAITEKKQIPIIYLSSHSDKEIINKAKKTNPYGYLLKTADDESIITTITMAYAKSEHDRIIIENEKRYAKKVRELNCYYGLSQIIEESSDSLSYILEKTAELIPVSLGLPAGTSVEISLKEYFYRYKTNMPGFSSINTPITINNSEIGNIGIFIDSDVFQIGDDKKIIESIALRIGQNSERIFAKNELKNLERELLIISEHERQRIGHDLHDSLGQLITGMSFLIKQIQLRTERNEFNNSLQLEELADLARGAAVQCREIARGLTPAVIANEGFIASLEQLASSIYDIFNVNCQITIKGTVITEENFVATQVFYIIKEAINNSIKHGKAENIDINISEIKGDVFIKITDDGTGLGKEDMDNPGMGLKIMKYRADLINAQFVSGNNEQKGFSIDIFLPVKKFST